MATTYTHTPTADSVATEDTTYTLIDRATVFVTDQVSGQAQLVIFDAAFAEERAQPIAVNMTPDKLQQLISQAASALAKQARS